MSRRPPLTGLQGQSGIGRPQGRQDPGQLSQHFDVHQNQIAEWKNQLLANAASAFEGTGKSEPEVNLKELHAKIGQQTLEIDFLAGALSKAGLLGRK